MKTKAYVSKLHMAVVMRNPTWVRRLLAEGYNPNIETGFLPLLHEAILNEDVEVAQMLVKSGASATPAFHIDTAKERNTFLFDGERVCVTRSLLNA